MLSENAARKVLKNRVYVYLVISLILIEANLGVHSCDTDLIVWPKIAPTFQNKICQSERALN